jgi:AhpD family alkylhydroperoxidase
MESRINFVETAGGALKAMYGIGAYVHNSTIEKPLLHLISFRVSQINGCAYCLDMHSKDLRAIGETEQRLYTINTWRETPFFTDRERAALAWAEAVTKLEHNEVSDGVFNEARAEFSEQELVDLTMEVILINSWNRINIAFHPPVGTYKVGEHAVRA